jgi:Skp family chaperone for outer membrane proteins
MAKHILVGLTALGLLATAFAGVSAQEAPPAPASIGVVDLDLVGAKFERKVQEEERLTEWYRQEQQRLEQLSSFLFVSEEEWKEVVEIHKSARNAWTEAQQKRVQTLKEQSTKWERDFRDLEAKPDRNDDEQNRLSLIAEISRSRRNDLQQLAVEVERELRQRQGDLGVALMEPVQAAVNQVATEKGLALVIEKRWVYFGGEDITEAVIALVNAAGAAAAQPETGGAGSTEKPEGADSETAPANEGGNQ